jgi:3'5'-cyclic nucleotide phosphodiesterase
MESTGKAGMIQVSSSTADLLIAAGKSHWLKEREDKVNAKGKGELTTFWLVPFNRRSQMHRNATVASIHPQSDSVSLGEEVVMHDDIENGNMERLVKWVVDGLYKILKDIEHQRTSSKQEHVLHDDAIRSLESALTNNGSNSTLLRVVNEVKEVIDFSRVECDATGSDDSSHTEDFTTFDEDIIHQLSKYIHVIATTYRNNSFHNFDHASHVTMSVIKMLSRIVQPKLRTTTCASSEKTMNDQICQIVSDPLTRFACIFAAIIHDCDHYGTSLNRSIFKEFCNFMTFPSKCCFLFWQSKGVPNNQLVKEQLPIAVEYDGKSVAEQNSIDVAFSVLMDGQYAKLRAAIYRTPSEFTRFRQLVVNCKSDVEINTTYTQSGLNKNWRISSLLFFLHEGVLATDIVDKDLKTLRNARWDRVFNTENGPTNDSVMDPSKRVLIGSQVECINRKATIIMEHLIQASDIAHTMQHWHIYRKWNECYFQECYDAYRNGRAEMDPAIYWYQGEIGFFDYYIIPLAKKLKDCGVFAVSSDEYYNYAVQNRQEWQMRGQKIVAEMVERFYVKDDKMWTVREEFVQENGSTFGASPAMLWLRWQQL